MFNTSDPKIDGITFLLNILTSEDHESLGNDHRKETTLKFYSHFFF